MFEVLVCSEIFEVDIMLQIPCCVSSCTDEIRSFTRIVTTQPRISTPAHCNCGIWFRSWSFTCCVRIWPVDAPKYSPQSWACCKIRRWASAVFPSTWINKTLFGIQQDNKHSPRSPKTRIGRFRIWANRQNIPLRPQILQFSPLFFATFLLVE